MVLNSEIQPVPRSPGIAPDPVFTLSDQDPLGDTGGEKNPSGTEYVMQSPDGHALQRLEQTKFSNGHDKSLQGIADRHGIDTPIMRKEVLPTVDFDHMPSYKSSMLLPLMLLFTAACDEDGTGLSLNIAENEAPPPGFILPVRDPSKIYKVIGFDHCPVDQGSGLLESATCINYEGENWNCYDGHEGNDFMLKGGFEAMDAGAIIVAAAPGKVINVVDGYFDECEGTLNGTVDCDGHVMEANRVVILHPDGRITRYLHMRKNSIIVKIGQEVVCGEKLGLIGSSGHSAAPHVHFEVLNLKDNAVDPYSGPSSRKNSLWSVQGPADGLPSVKCPNQ